MAETRRCEICNQYERQRDSYTPEAIKYANETMGVEPEFGTHEMEKYNIDWDLIYLRRMVEICNEHGMGVTA